MYPYRLVGMDFTLHSENLQHLADQSSLTLSILGPDFSIFRAARSFTSDEALRRDEQRERVDLKRRVQRAAEQLQPFLLRVIGQPLARLLAFVAHARAIMLVMNLPINQYRVLVHSDTCPSLGKIEGLRQRIVRSDDFALDFRHVVIAPWIIA